MMLAFLKKYFPNAPRFVGDIVATIPFSLRMGFGKDYCNALRNIDLYEKLSSDEKRCYIFEKVYRVVNFAVKNIPFYQQYYCKHHFSIDSLKCFDDLIRIPVISKKVLQEWVLEDRCCRTSKKVISYTGGSTGEPLKFYSDPRQIGNEWAHIHRIWSKLGYCQQDLLISVVLEPTAPPVFYDALRHSLVLNIHFPREKIISTFKAIPLKYRQVKYFRGYPSAWAEILTYLELNDYNTLVELRETLKGSFLASEFPHPIFRSAIERLTQCPTISWIGHSERAFLAWEKTEQFLYEPMHSYGYCEAVEEAGQDLIVGTSYFNYAFPFIRYKTDDSIKIIDVEGGILNSFEVLEGRSGDYLIDKNGASFSITHLNLSCREETWKLVRCVQIEQTIPGKITLLITPRVKVTQDQLISAFNFDALNLDCDFKILERPVTTSRGKVLLKIPSQSILP